MTGKSPSSPARAWAWCGRIFPEDETPLIDIVLAADTERHNLLLEAETAEDPQRIADIYTRLSGYRRLRSARPRRHHPFRPGLRP